MQSSIEKLFAFGINFRDASVEVRSAFSLSESRQEQILQLAKGQGIEELMLICTCNRMEFYGRGSGNQIVSLFCSVSGYSRELLESVLFEKTGYDALAHIFEVAAGLNSQILGDYEILGQFRQSASRSSDMKLFGPFFHRLVNTAVQASKQVKTNTDLSKGAVSASFAAIELLRRSQPEDTDVLLIGTGKFGSAIAKNIRAYLPKAQVCLVNRTDAKAQALAKELGFSWVPFEELPRHAHKHRVVISCAFAEKYLLEAQHLAGASTELIMDISIPRSIDPQASQLNGVRVYDIDEISKMLSHTLEKRKEEVPCARQILESHQESFVEWVYTYDRSDVIRRVKKQLTKISENCPYLSRLDNDQINRKINKALSLLVSELKTLPEGCVDEESIIQRFISSNHPAVPPLRQNQKP